MKKSVILIFFIALALRLYFIFNNSISFHYDMSRDAFIALEIYKNLDLKIIGPPTSTPGLFHGVLYYYLLAPFYFLSSGDPKGPAILIAVLNSFSVFPIFFMGRAIFGKWWGILAAALFAISFEAVQYGTWISNPSPAVFIVAVYFLGLYIWLKGDKRGAVLATFSASLAVQFQFFLLYLLPLIALFKIIFKTKLDFKFFALSFFAGLLPLSTFIISSLKFSSAGSSLTGFIGNIDHYYFKLGFSEAFLNYLNKLADVYINNIFPTNVFLGGILGILSLFALKKYPFLLFAVFSSLFIYLFGGHSSNYANIGIIVPVILSFIAFIKVLTNFRRSLAIILLFLVFSSNLFTVFKITPQGQHALVIPKDMYLKNELQLVDRTYQIAANKPFSINTLTLPLWTNTTWAYLYHFHGEKKYGYKPSFHGNNPIGSLGEKVLEYDQKPKQTSFFIIEPLTGIPANFAMDELNAENSRTKLISEESFSSLKLQIREPLK